MSIPKDPVILLSFINLKLRDEFTNLEELCKGLMIDQEELSQKLGTIEYHYDMNTNQFK